MLSPNKCQEVSAVITESDIVVEDEAEECHQKRNRTALKYGIISNNYFNYQPVTLNQIEEVKSGGEESKTQSDNKVVF
jgi:hypothetical protein